MKIAIHLVGPQDTVKLVENVAAAEFADKIHLASHIYTDVEEVPQIVREHNRNGDIWLCTGSVVAEMAMASQPDIKSVTIPLGGTALMKMLYMLVRNGHHQIDRLSIDTLPEQSILETFAELEVQEGKPFIHPRSGYVPASELITYHESLFRAGKVDICLTPRSFVFDSLQKKGVPARRIIPTIMSIRQTIHLACQHGETNHFRKSQIAMLLIRIHNMLSKGGGAYEIYKMSLKIQEAILQFTEDISGAMIPIGKDTYTIFSTRGALEQNNSFPPSTLLERLRLMTNGTVHFGIGYGLTALEAEQNATMALDSEESRNGGLIVVDNNGTIGGSLKNIEHLTYEYRSDNADTIEKLKREGVSIATFKKIIAVQNSLGRQEVTANDIVQWLGMTQRNANRILTELERCGMAAIVGEEAPMMKGRPRKLFRINPS